MNPDDQKKIMDMINMIKPELIVFDTFVKVHHQKEGDAQEIVPVTFRNVLQRHCTWVFITRKPGPDQQGPQTANDLRGSGGIFGEANGIFVLSSRTGRAHFSSALYSLRRGNSQTTRSWIVTTARSSLLTRQNDASTLAVKLGEVFGSATLIQRQSLWRD